MKPNNGRRRIVLTGGPGAGKTTAADLFRRELGEQVVIVPEAATLLFSGGFPRVNSPFAQKAAQKAIYYVQTNLEDVQTAAFPNRILLCDRGTVDSAAFWPDDGNSKNDFFKDLGLTYEEELNRYDAVLFFESAAIGNISIEGGNPTRIESVSQAIALDKKLYNVWSKHSQFIFIPHEASFFNKLNNALVALKALVRRLDH